MSRLVLVGAGLDGPDGLPPRLRRLLAEADTLVGDAALLDRVPRPFAQARERWPRPLAAGVRDLLARHEGYAVVGLVAGDPVDSALGRELAGLLGDALQLEPAVTTASLVRARLGWPDAEVVDLRGRDPGVLARELAPGRRLVLLLDPGAARAVAELLVARGYGRSVLTRLAGDARVRVLAELWSAATAEAAGALGVDLVGPLVSPWLGGLPDASYEPVGGVTGRDLRTSALARLAPQPGQLLWDLGSGGGSLAVEWLRAHRSCRAVALAADEASRAVVLRNAGRHGTPELDVVVGRGPRSLAGSPDAIHVGLHVGLHVGPHTGTALDRGLVEACLAVLRPAGRLVVQTTHAAPLLDDLYAALGGELTRVAVEVAGWVDGAAAWSPRPPVTQWAWQRP